LCSNFKIFIQKVLKMTNSSVHEHSQSLLGGFSEMPLRDLERFISELNALVIQKRVTDKGKQDKALLLKINQAILPEQTMEQYVSLQEKMEDGNISDAEYQDLLIIVTKEEKIRNKRVQYLIELSQLRGITLPVLMNDLGLNTVKYA
jgi:hypothetical protein